jgi:hypothetical protein
LASLQRLSSHPKLLPSDTQPRLPYFEIICRGIADTNVGSEVKGEIQEETPQG